MCYLFQIYTITVVLYKNQIKRIVENRVEVLGCESGSDLVCILIVRLSLTCYVPE